MTKTILASDSRRRGCWLWSFSSIIVISACALLPRPTLALDLPGSSLASVDDASTQRLREEFRELMLGMIESGTFDPKSIESPLSITEPARRVVSLGVLVDSASGARARQGLRVLGTTPGSNAERIGLRSGDILLSFNTIDLVDLGDAPEGGARAAILLRESVDRLADNSTVSFAILRDARRTTVSGTLKSVWVPEFSLTLNPLSAATLSAAATSDVSEGEGCGRISVRDLAPRQQQLHGATLTQIDGKTPGTTGQEVFRVPAGRHLLEVGERIDNRYLSFNDRLRNAGRTYKKIEIDVEPNTTYFLAARLNEARRTEWKDGAYWEPNVWKSIPETCR